MRRLFAAIQFLTILPTPGGGPPASGAVFFPLIGAAIGVAAAGVRDGAALVFPAPIAALLALGVLILATGALHEDGLADVFDAFRAGRSPERILSILKDSRIGVYGAVALVMTLLLRWQCVEHLAHPAAVSLAAAAGASRGTMVALAALSRPVGEGLGKDFCLGLGKPAAVLAAIQSAALPFLCGPAVGVAALIANTAAIAAARAYFHRRVGGVTGDCLGAICQISELLMLLILVCPRFI